MNESQSSLKAFECDTQVIKGASKEQTQDFCVGFFVLYEGVHLTGGGGG